MGNELFPVINSLETKFSDKQRQVNPADKAKFSPQTG